MHDPSFETEIKDRLALIESMLSEGRRVTERWGWTFVLWGVAYYVAIGWSLWRPSPWAWPVTIVAACIATFVLVSMQAEGEPETKMGRAVISIWIALGTTMVVLFVPLGLSGRLGDVHYFIAVASAILGMANGASAMILRWKVQMASAMAWWAAAVLSCFGSEQESLIVFLVAIFFCQIVFGIYCSIAESRERKMRGPHNGATHA